MACARERQSQGSTLQGVLVECSARQIAAGLAGMADSKHLADSASSCPAGEILPETRHGEISAFVIYYPSRKYRVTSVAPHKYDLGVQMLRTLREHPAETLQQHKDRCQALRQVLISSTQPIGMHMSPPR